MTTKEKAAAVVDILKRRYPDTCSLVAEKDYELLFSTRLSAQCTDARVNVVEKELYARYPTLQAMQTISKAAQICCWSALAAECRTPWRSCGPCPAWAGKRPT